MKYITIILIYILSCSCTGLIHIKANNPIKAFTSRYNETQKQYPGLLVKADSLVTLCDLVYKESSHVYLVNGLQLKQCIAEYENAIVYIWDAHCPSKQCFSPSLLQKYCRQKNVELFVVAEYYDGAELIQFYEIDKPILGIDTEYYKSNFIDRYVSKFEGDLDVSDNTTGRMLYFKNGKYIGRAVIEFE